MEARGPSAGNFCFIGTFYFPNGSKVWTDRGRGYGDHYYSVYSHIIT